MVETLSQRQTLKPRPDTMRRKVHYWVSVNLFVVFLVWLWLNTDASVCRGGVPVFGVDLVIAVCYTNTNFKAYANFSPLYHVKWCRSLLICDGSILIFWLMLISRIRSWSSDLLRSSRRGFYRRQARFPFIISSIIQLYVRIIQAEQVPLHKH